MLQTTPKNKYKSVNIGENVSITGYKSTTCDYSEGLHHAKLNNNQVSLQIRTNHDASDFKFEVNGRENLEKLKEIVDFALEIKEDD